MLTGSGTIINIGFSSTIDNFTALFYPNGR